MNSHLFQPSTVTVTFSAVSATATEHIICIISHVHGCEVEERELITLIFALRHENTEVLHPLTEMYDMNCLTFSYTIF